MDVEGAWWVGERGGSDLRGRVQLPAAFENFGRFRDDSAVGGSG